MGFGQYKLTLLGESSTGKTSLALRITNDKFSNYQDSTIGASYSTFIHNNLRYDIWDTAGQERYAQLISFYYRNTDIFLMVFDVSNYESIDKVFTNLDKIYYENNVNKAKIFIVGNKTDLLKSANETIEIKKKLEIMLNKLDYYKELQQNIEIIFVSAKDKTGIVELKSKIITFCENVKKTNILNDFGFSEPTDNIKLNIEEKRYCYC